MALIYHVEGTDSADFPKNLTESSEPNAPPRGFREITEEEVCHSTFATYTPNHIGYEQINWKGEWLPVKLFFMHDETGIAMHLDYWKKKIRWFAFGCDHQYVELSQEECAKQGIRHYGMCWHVLKCSVCSYVTAHDSSD